MQIKKNITIELSEKDVKEIIVDYLNKEGYKITVDDISFFVGSRIEGYGMGEHKVNYFRAAYKKCKEK